MGNFILNKSKAHYTSHNAKRSVLFLFTKYKLKSYISSLVAKSDMQNKFCVILRLVVAVILNKSLTCRQVNTTAVWQYHLR